MVSISFTNRIRALLVAFSMFIGVYFWHNEGQTLLDAMDLLLNISIGHWGVFLKIICLCFGLLFLAVGVKG